MPTIQTFLGWQEGRNLNVETLLEFAAPDARARGDGVALQVRPRLHKLLPGEPVGIDFEHQEYLDEGDVHPPGHQKAGHARWRRRLGWVAAVNTAGEIVYDAHCYYPRKTAELRCLRRNLA